MNTEIRNSYRRRAEILKALAHPSRLFIVEEVAKGERCVLCLSQALGQSMPTVSRHLSVLRNAGILEDEKRGKQVFYSLRAKCLPQLLQCLEEELD